VEHLEDQDNNEQEAVQEPTEQEIEELKKKN
jgi:hypothetical protein